MLVSNEHIFSGCPCTCLERIWCSVSPLFRSTWPYHHTFWKKVVISQQVVGWHERPRWGERGCKCHWNMCHVSLHNKVCNYCHCQKKLQKVPEDSFQPWELIEHQIAKFEVFSFSIRNAATALFLMSFVREKGRRTWDRAGSRGFSLVPEVEISKKSWN